MKHNYFFGFIFSIFFSKKPTTAYIQKVFQVCVIAHTDQTLVMITEN